MLLMILINNFLYRGEDAVNVFCKNLHENKRWPERKNARE